VALLMGVGTLRAAEEVLPKHITPQTLKAVRAGLDYLARSQGDNGSWQNDQGGESYPVAMTGLAGAPMREAAEMPVFLRAVLPRAAEDSTASRAAQIYNPTPRPPRPFEADYPSRAPADAAGNLTKDIEGRPLTAP